MFKYRVLEKRFHNGAMYEPGGKRQFIIVEKPFDPIPTGLELVGQESDEEREQRERLELAQSEETIAQLNEDADEKAEAYGLFSGFMRPKNKSTIETL